jgi:hypothetical protein
MANRGQELFAYQDRLVAFVDVLGFSQLTLLSEKDDAALAKIGKLVATNRLFEAFFGKLMDRAKVAFFSDSFVVSMGPDEIFYLVREIGYLSRYLLLLGMPCRGGISRGLLHHDGPVIVGPALIHAYQLEHCIAKMPRVILDDAAMDCWRNEFKAEPAHADCEKLVQTDPEGIHQLALADTGWTTNFLPWTEFIPARDSIPATHEEFLVTARAQIARGLAAAKDEGVRVKYNWLAQNI